MIQLPPGFTLEDLAQREALDPELDRITREWVLTDPDFQAWEVEQCRKNFDRLARRWLTIRTPRGPMRLRFKPAQLRLHRLVQKLVAEQKPVRVNILKARQEGMSTYCQALQFWICGVKQTHVSGLTVAHDVESVQTLLSMSRLFVDEVPDFLRPELKYNTKNHLEFSERRSDMRLATEKNAKAGRSRTLVFVHGSEVAFWGKASQTTTSLYQAVPLAPGTFIFQESTANGVGGHFYEHWRETQQRQDRGEETEWVNLFISWLEEPTYQMRLYDGEAEDFLESLNEEEQVLREEHGATVEQLKWRRRKIAGDLGGDVEKFHQEFPTFWEEAFISTGRPYCNRHVLVGWRREIEAGPQPMPYPLVGVVSRIRAGREDVTPVEAVLHVYELPQPGVEYVVGADVAEGISPNPNNTDPDWSVADVGRLDTWDQTAELRIRCDPDVFGVLLDQIGRMYNNAKLAPEAHGLGVTVINTLVKVGYPNLFYRASATGEPQAGWQTDLATKPQMLAAGKAAIRDKVGKIRSLPCLEQHMALEVHPNGKVAVTAGHDDHVSARSIRIKVTELLAPIVQALNRAEGRGDLMERLRRYRQKAMEEGRQRERDRESEGYYDEVLGRVS
ncbi:MAG TPA: hypothetical protein VM695_09975 [Phycisphaerae bacterium]|nr:hypothetical protein [Phycisphaerae bacterium]